MASSPLLSAGWHDSTVRKIYQVKTVTVLGGLLAKFSKSAEVLIFCNGIVMSLFVELTVKRKVPPKIKTSSGKNAASSFMVSQLVESLTKPLNCGTIKSCLKSKIHSVFFPFGSSRSIVCDEEHFKFQIIPPEIQKFVSSDVPILMLHAPIRSGSTARRLVPSCIRMACAETKAIGWLLGSLLIAICLVCQPSFAAKPASEISIAMPSIKTTHPKSSNFLWAFQPPENLSFIHSASFSKIRPKNTNTPPIVAQISNPIGSESTDEIATERKKLDSFTVHFTFNLRRLPVFSMRSRSLAMA